MADAGATTAFKRPRLVGLPFSLAVALAFLTAGSALAQATTARIKVLLDTDDNPATGCTVSTPAGPFSGAEQVVITTFDTASHEVTGVQVALCSGAVLGPPSPMRGPFTPPWPIGPGNGASASTLIETYFPLGTASVSQIHVGFVLGDTLVDQDALLPSALIPPAGAAAPIPTLSQWGLILLSISLLLLGVFLLRHHPGGLAAIGVIAILAGTAGMAWAAITLDGQASDWAGIPPLATKPASPNPTHPEILAVYGVTQGSNLFFRVDANLAGGNPTPSPTPTSTASPTPTPTPPAGTSVTLDPVPDQTIPTNTTLSLRLAGHSTDALAVLTYGLVAGPAGTSVSPLGVFSFSPAQSQIGPQSVTVKVQDQSGRIAQTAFQVMVVDHDHAPQLDPLADDSASVGVVYTRNLTATDPDPGDILTFTLLSGPAGMTLSGSTLSWTPTAAQLGNWPVQVKVTDRAGLSASGLFHVGIAFLTATDDEYSVNLGKTLTVAAPGVLGNDVDPLSGPLSATKLSDPDKGALNAFNADGSFTYQAPAVLPGPVFAPVVKYHIDNVGYDDPALVADVDGDGKPELIFLGHGGGTAPGITAVRGTDGSVLWNTPSLPAPYGDCTAGLFTAGNLYHLALGDIDDSGQLSIVFPTSCGRDNLPSMIVGTNVARYAALNARDGSVKWLSPPLSRELDANGNPDNFASGTVPTIARVRFGETPSIVVGNDVGYFLFNGKPECDQLVPGWRANVACRGIFVLDGVDGSVRQRMAAPTTGSLDRTTYGNGTQAAVVADLDGDGSNELVFGGAVFNNDGSVRSNNNSDGTGYALTFWTGLGNFDDTPDIEVARLEGGAAGAGLGYRLTVYKSDGSQLWSLPLPATSYLSVPVIADVDGSGRPAVVLSVDGNVCAVDSKGTYKWCHDVGAPGGVSNVALGSRIQVFDLDGDGVPEVMVGISGEQLLFLDGATGSVKFSLDMDAPPVLPPYLDFGAGGPVIADIDGSGHASIVTLWGGVGRLDVVSSANNDWRPARKIFNQESYQFGNINDDGTIPKKFFNNFAIPATNVFGAQPQVLTPVDPRKRSQTVFTYSASDSGLTSPPGNVTIDILPVNRPPVFVSEPPTRYLAQSSFSYTAQAIDPDPGDTVTYSLTLGQGNGAGAFGNCAMAPSTGVLSCGILFSGEQDFIIAATDSFGAAAYQNIKVFDSSGPAAVPNVVGQQQTAAGAALTAAGFATGNVTKIDNPAPAGQVVQQNPGGGTQALLGSSVDLVVSNGPPPPPPPPGPPPSLANIKRIVVTPAATARVVGDTLQYKAVAIYTDNTSADISFVATWTSSPSGIATVDAAGVARAVGPGSTLVTAAAGGLSGLANLSVTARVNGDNTRPSAIITQPASGGTVTGLTQIVGTATDPNFVRYEIALEASGDSTFTLIGQGTTQVTNDVLGTLDPTLLLNGAYTLQLTVFDAGGNTAMAQVPILLDGFQKVGNFTISYVDLAVPLAGIPIQITRTYDSRDKRTGDFGVGWSLGIKALRVSSSGILGTKWQVVQQSTTFALVPDTDHFVSVVLPSGKVDTFDLSLTPTSSFLVPFSTLQATFVARPGTFGTLQTLDNANILIVDPQPGPITLLDDVTLNTFDPDRFLYTQLDGTQFIVSRMRGVQSVTDSNGNQITISPGGISHSSGASVVFTRDASSRITSITDPKGQTHSYLYSAAGDLASHTDAAGSTTSYFYNAAHGLVRIQDPLGRPVARTEYDDAGRLLSITDAAGNVVNYAHDVSGRQDQVEDALGRVTVFNYDDRGNLLSLTDPLGHTTTSTFDAQDNETSRVDPDGLQTAMAYNGILPTSVIVDPGGLNLTTTNVYDAANNPTMVTDPAGRVSSFAYDGNGNVTQLNTPLAGSVTAVVNAQGVATRVTDSLGNSTVSTLDAFGNTTREDVLDSTSTLLRRTDFTYDANGNKLTETLSRTINGVLTPLTTWYAYDAAGRNVSITDPSGGITRFEYDAAGQQTAVVDPLGRRRTSAYDDLGRVVLTTYPDGTSEAASYDVIGNVVSRTDRAGRVTTFEYDLANRRVKTILPDGSFSQTVYSPGGLVAATIDAKGNRTDIAYDAAGRRTGITLPAVVNGVGGPLVRPQISNVFSPLGVFAATIDPNGRQTSFQHDVAGHPVQTTFADGSFVQQAFDALGRRTSVTNEDGQSTQFAYDGLGRLVGVSGLAGDATYAYDEADNLVAQTDALGRSTTFRYDALNRLVKRIYPGGESDQLTYDAVGNQIAITDPNGKTTALTYDSMNQAIREDLPDASTVSYTYTADGQRASATDSRGLTLRSYDAVGRLASVLFPTGETIQYSRDANGNLLSMASPAASVNYLYDALDRLVQVNSPEGQTQYFYDLGGNRVRLAAPNGIRTDAVYDARNRPTLLTHTSIGGTVLQSFTNVYSASGRRTQVTELDGSQETYTYDAKGHLSSETRTGTGALTISHVYDAAGNRTLLTRNGVTTPFTYDSDDRLQSAGIANYTHDANGNLISVTAGAATTQYGYDAKNRLTSITDGSGVSAFAYDADGNRVQAITPAGTTRFLVDSANDTGLSQVLEERDGGGNLQARYSYGLDMLAMTRGAAPSFYHRDVHGSTRLLSDGTGAVTDTYRYEGYGSTSGITGATTNPYLYSGERFDAGSGLYQLRARYYAPGLGRFVSRDPAPGRPEAPVSLHRYLYASGDPLDNVDPSGLTDTAELTFVQGIQSLISAANFFSKASAVCRIKPTLGMVAVAGVATVVATNLLNGAPTGTGVQFSLEIPLSLDPFEQGSLALQYSNKNGVHDIGLSISQKAAGYSDTQKFNPGNGANGSFTLDVSWPPVTATGTLAATLETTLKEFRCVPAPVPPIAKITFALKPSVKFGGSANGAIFNNGFSAELRFTLFTNKFRFTFPFFAIDANRLNGTGNYTILGFNYTY